MKTMKAKDWMRAAALTLLCWLGASCGKDEDLGIGERARAVTHLEGRRLASEEKRRVLLFYECGFNSLYRDLYSDVNTELDEGFIPGSGRNDNVLLVFSKLAKNSSYKPVKSYLRRLYLDSDSNLVSDTLRVFEENVIAASGETIREVLGFVKESFPAKSYGMVFSSHGTGWLPTGYYADPSAYERTHSPGRGGAGPFSLNRRTSSDSSPSHTPSGNLSSDPFRDLVKIARGDEELSQAEASAGFRGTVRSVGNEKQGGEDYEMSLDEFTNGIPFHLDYLLFDMCFSAGVESFYAMRDVADRIGGSPTEVLGEGMFDYTKISSFLLGSEEPDLLGLFKDSFQKYDSQQEAAKRSSTVNLIRTDRLEGLASVCADLIKKYRTAIDNAPSGNIQGYFRMSRHYFYDLEDLFVKCGASEGDLKALRTAIEDCVIYRDATPSFLNSFEIKTYSGFSTYLPCRGTPLLDSFYRDEAWNKVVGMVE